MKKTSLLSILLVNALVLLVVFAYTIFSASSERSQATDFTKQPHLGHSSNHHKKMHSEKNEKSLSNGTVETGVSKRKIKSK